MVFKDLKSTGKLVMKKSSGMNRPLNLERWPMSSTVSHTHSLHWEGPYMSYWEVYLSLIHISEPTRRVDGSRMPSSA